jgi:hypothetical protein
VIVWRSLVLFPVVTLMHGLHRVLRVVGSASHRFAERVSDASDTALAWSDPEDVTGHRAWVRDLKIRRKQALQKSYAEYERWMA